EKGGTIGFFVLSPDGKRLAAPTARNAVRVWDVETGKSLALLEGHTQQVRSVALSPDGKKLLSGGNDGTTRLWDVAKGKEVRQVATTRGNVRAVAFSHDGKRVAHASSDEQVRVWEAATGKEVASGAYSGGGQGGFGSVELSFLPGDKRLALGGQGRVGLWDVE